MFLFHVVFEFLYTFEHVHSPIILVAQPAEDIEELDAATVVPGEDLRWTEEMVWDLMWS